MFASAWTEHLQLKYYEKAANRVFKVVEEKRKNVFVKTSDMLCRLGDTVFCSAPYPSNELYVLGDDLRVTLDFRLDFGKHNFSADDLPEGLSPSFYYEYMSMHPEYAYPFTKYRLDDWLLAFFQMGENLCVAYKHRRSGKGGVFKNEKGSYAQLMVPDAVQDDRLYYASEPAYLPYVIDTTLMRKADVARVASVGATDNPVIVIYQLKRDV